MHYKNKSNWTIYLLILNKKKIFFFQLVDSGRDIKAKKKKKIGLHHMIFFFFNGTGKMKTFTFLFILFHRITKEKERKNINKMLLYFRIQ